MIFSIYQEFYKLLHRKIVWIAPMAMLVLMIVTGYTIGFDEGKLVTMTCYDAPDWIMLILVIVGSTTFSMEFQNNAILTLLYKSSNKAYVYLSKFIVIFIYDIFLHLLAIIFTVFLRYAPMNKRVPWTQIYRYGQPLWENMVKTTGVDLFTTMLIISLVFLLSCLFNNNAIVISVSFLIVFMGQFVSSTLLNLDKFLNILKWNPFNMINLTRQFYNYASYSGASHLTIPQLVFGTLIYIIVFTGLGYSIFRKKRF